MDIKEIILTVIGMFVDCMLLLQYMSLYKMKKCTGYKVCIAYSTFFVINCILGISNFPFAIRTFCNLILIVYIGYFYYEQISIYALGKEAILFILLLGVSELFVIPIVFLFTGTFDAEIFSDVDYLQLWVISFGLSRLIAIFLFKASRRIQKKNYFKLKKEELTILYFPLVISLTAFLVIAKFVLDIDRFEKEDLVIPLSVVAVVLIFSTLLHMLFFEKYMRDRDKERQIKLLKQKNNLQYEYYKKQIDSYKDIRILYHDLKNHMLVANNSKYYEKIEKKLNDFEGFISTGSNILNVLMWQKITEAKEKGIEVETIVEEINYSFIDEMDLCSIVGNILDNAIEACCEVDRNCIPEINIRMAQVNNLIIIKVENDCVSNARHKTIKGFETTKLEKNIHGIGLLSVEKAVEKYDGNFEVSCSENKFYSEVLIPIPIRQ